MKLYTINFDFNEPDIEGDWLHIVLKEYPTYEKQMEIVNKHMQEEYGATYEVFNIYCNELDVVDGYKITVTKLGV